MEKINLYLNEIAKLFGYEYNELFFSYLKSISQPNNQVCNKCIPNGEGGWKCLDCEIDSLSLICNVCFSKSKDKHKGHKISFDPSNNGYCDCGDPNVILEEAFCPDHKGPFTNEKDLMNYIKNSFDEKLLFSIDNILNNIFNMLIEKINNLYNKCYDNQQQKNDEEGELFNMIDILISFCSNLYINNLGLFYFVTLKFTENFPFETNHKCFKYKEDESLIIMIKENQFEKHNCICPFFQILINVLMTRKTIHDSENFFSLFIQNYKNKLITSLSFLHTFTQLFSNDNLTIFRGMGYQLLSDQLSELVYEEKNIKFLENFYIEIYNKAKEYLDLKNYINAEQVFSKLYEIIIYLPKLKIIDKIKSNFSIFNIIIDTICLINNLNVFENKIKFTIYQRDGYLYNLYNCDLNCLITAVLICELFDFNNLNLVKLLFNKLILQLKDDKKYKESLPDKIFSPHIINIRIYSIFLNRFCFNYSIKNNVDLLNSFQYFQNLLPESKEINSFLFKELISYFGFIISQKYSFFSYFGNGMEMYYSNYFSSRIYINCDITLMKYLLCLPEIQNYFNINNILSYSNIESSNDFLINLKEENLNQKNENLLQLMKEQEKNIKYINSIFEFILQIIKDNLSMINLCFKFSNKFRMKYSDKLFDDLLEKDKINFENIIRNQIIHYIIGNKNIVQRENCIKLYTQFSNKYLSPEFVDKILKEKCNIISSSNQLKQFSLKKENFQFCDIDYIIDYSERVNALNYMTDFQKNNYNPLNTYISNSLSIQQQLYNKIYDNIFNKNSIEKFITFYTILNTNNNYPILTDIFLFTCSKFISFFIELYSNSNIYEEYKNILLFIIDKNKLDGTNSKTIEYIQKLLSKEEIKNENKKLAKKKNYKEKYKKLFDEQNNFLLKKYSSSNEINFEEEESISSQKEEICIYCRQPLIFDLNNYYGKLCYIFRDYFIDILKNKEENLRQESTRIVTCNHKIHFGCFTEFIIKYINNNPYLTIRGFQCPLCKKLSNTMICDFTSLIENNENIIKGLTLNDENIDKFYINNSNNEGDINPFKNIIIYNKNCFESYCSRLLNKEIIINDLNNNKTLIEQIYNLFIKDFDSFIIYYNITNYKKEQIDIWKNLLLTIRLLCKYKKINLFEFLFSKFKLIYKSLEDFNFSYMSNSEISLIINELIFCLFILYDLTEENKNTIKNLFQNCILIHLFIFQFIKSKETKFDEFLNKKENEDSLKKIFELYKLKYKICFLFYDEKEENLNLNFEQSIQFLKEKVNINSLKNNFTNLFIKEQYLEIPKFNPIKLPENYMEFCSKYANINCINCNKKNKDYYICLICGNKICDVTSCITELEPGKKEYSLKIHSKKCGGGNVLFISNINSQIIYLLKDYFINSGIYVYLNSFGEYIKDYYQNDNYVLNKVELEKGIQLFIDMTFRK